MKMFHAFMLDYAIPLLLAVAACIGLAQLFGCITPDDCCCRSHAIVLKAP